MRLNICTSLSEESAAMRGPREVKRRDAALRLTADESPKSAWAGEPTRGADGGSPRHRDGQVVAPVGVEGRRLTTSVGVLVVRLVPDADVRHDDDLPPTAGCSA